MQTITVHFNQQTDAANLSKEENVQVQGTKVTFERVIDYTELPSGTLKLVCNPRTHLIAPRAWTSVDIFEGAADRQQQTVR